VRIVLQRVARASVSVDGEVVGKIDRGVLLLVGFAKPDDEATLSHLSRKVLHLRIFPDEAGKMNRSLLELGGDILAVSQFTLCGNTRKGRRPSFERAALPEVARTLFEAFVAQLKDSNLNVETGCFGADMQVELLNDGPVTFVLDSPEPKTP